MIKIVNVGNTDLKELEDTGGERNYDIIIAGKLICTFKHFRRDGLAICLEKAVEEVKKND